MFNINSETLANLKNEVITKKLKAKSAIYNFHNDLVEQELRDLGFLNITEDATSTSEIYVRHNDEYNYTHVVTLSHKANGNHLLQSYAKENLAKDHNGVPIGNACVGLTYRELMAFTLKMHLLGLEN